MDDINNKIETLRKEVNEIFQQSFDIDGVENSLNWYNSHPKVKEYNNLIKLYEKTKDYKLTDFKKSDDHMPISEFISYCKSGFITDYDGVGYYATENKKSNIEVDISDILSGEYRKDFTHIVWYNK